jgi:hypothetical protein
MDGELPRLERLPQRVEHDRRELECFIEEQDSPGGSRRQTRSDRAGATPQDGGCRRSVMRGLERRAPKQLGPDRLAAEGTHRHHVEGLVDR